MEQIIKRIPLYIGTGAGNWGGYIELTVDHEAVKGQANVTAQMYYYATDSGVPKYGGYRHFLQITKDGAQISMAGSGSVATYYWLTEGEILKLGCSATISYEESCNLGCNGWVICDEGDLAGGSLSGSESMTLTRLEPASTILTDQLEVQMGKNLLITVNRHDSTYLHKLSYTFGGKTETIAENVGGSHGWTVPDLAALCNNALSGVCTLTCETFHEGNSVGTTTAYVTLRVQDPTVPSVEGSQVTLGTGSTITCKRGSGNFTLRLEYQFQGVTESIGQIQADTHLWTPGYALAKQIPTLTYATGTLKCTTFNGTAEVGVETTTVRAIVPENAVTKPAFSLEGLKLSPVSDLGEVFEGIYLRGKTGLQAEFSASSQYSAVKEYSITAGSVSASGNPAIIPVLVNEGEVKVTAKVTDERGFSTTVSTTIPILPYRKPRVIPYTGYSQVVCERALETGEIHSGGTFLAIKAGKSYSSVVVGGMERNACLLRYRWKLSGAADYGDWITLLPTDSAAQEISLLAAGVVSSLSSSYDVELSALDNLGGEHRIRFPIMTESVSFVLYDGEDGAGFGKYPEAPHVVDIATHMTLRVRGALEVDAGQWQDLGFADGVIESVYARGRKEDSGCHCMVWEGSHVYAAFNCSFFYSGSPVLMNAVPIPENIRPLRPVYSLCPVNDRGIALVSVDTDGYIRTQWVLLTDTAATGEVQVTWIDGYLDYWVE